MIDLIIYKITYDSNFSDKGAGKIKIVKANSPAEAILAIMKSEPVNQIVKIKKECLI